MPQRADGAKIELLIQELATSEGRRVGYSEICRRTDELGDGYVAIEETTLRRARKGKRVDESYLKSLAKVLGVELSDLVKSDAEEKNAGDDGGGVRIKKKMIAKSKKNAPAVNAEEHAHVSISISNTTKD